MGLTKQEKIDLAKWVKDGIKRKQSLEHIIKTLEFIGYKKATIKAYYKTFCSSMVLNNE